MRRVFVILALCLAEPASAQYAVVHTYQLGGEGSWDYVIPDPPHHRLFIARQNRMMVVDELTGALVGEITGIKGAHGVALVDKTGRGFATSGNDSSIYMFDATSLNVLSHIPAAEDADAIIYDAASDRVFSFNGDAHNATAVDAGTGKLIRNVPLGGKPESGVAAGNGKVYVNLTDVSEVVEVDSKTLNVTRRWSTAPCKQPVSMAIDVVHGRLFSGCRSGVAAISDIAAGRIVATLPIGQGVDGTAFDPATGDAFFSTIDGALTIIHENSPNGYDVVQTLKTIERGRNMGLDPLTHQVFVVGARFEPLPAESAAANPRRRPAMIGGSFSLLVIERQSNK